jgi:hypothetical protein
MDLLESHVKALQKGGSDGDHKKAVCMALSCFYQPESSEVNMRVLDSLTAMSLVNDQVDKAPYEGLSKCGDVGVVVVEVLSAIKGLGSDGRQAFYKNVCTLAQAHPEAAHCTMRLLEMFVKKLPYTFLHELGPLCSIIPDSFPEAEPDLTARAMHVLGDISAGAKKNGTLSNPFKVALCEALRKCSLRQVDEPGAITATAKALVAFMGDKGDKDCDVKVAACGAVPDCCSRALHVTPTGDMSKSVGNMLKTVVDVGSKDVKVTLCKTLLECSQRPVDKPGAVAIIAKALKDLMGDTDLEVIRAACDAVPDCCSRALHVTPSDDVDMSKSVGRMLLQVVEVARSQSEVKEHARSILNRCGEQGKTAADRIDASVLTFTPWTKTFSWSSSAERTS